MAYNKTEYVYVQGKVKWFRYKAPDDWGFWKHQMWMNPASLDKIRELQGEGLKNIIKKDEDGEFTTFRRPVSKVMRGKVVGFAPPLVYEADGKTPITDYQIGNGSDVTTKLEVYSHPTPGGGSAKACRWLSSRIDHLVPFDNKTDPTESEEKAQRGLDEQPEQLF